MTELKPNQKICIFCDAPLDNDNRSREHVIPQWLSEHLKIKNMPITPTHRSGKTGKTLSIRKHTISDVVEGRVCVKCNNEWMSSLESGIRPFLIKLMNSEILLDDLNNSQRIQLARWACKTTWLLNSSSNYINNVPDKHFKHIYRNTSSLPQRVIVLAQQHKFDRSFHWIQFPIWEAEIDDSITEADVTKLIKKTYKISLQLGDLMLLVAFWPHDDWFYSLQIKLHIPLWPGRGKCGWHSGKNWHKLKSEEAFLGFHYSLKIITEEKLETCMPISEWLPKKSYH